MRTVVERPQFLTSAIVLIVCIVYAALSSGCAVPSVRSYADGVLSHGSTIEDMKKRACNDPKLPCQDWRKPDYYRENGNAVYREITNPYCWYHWEVNQEGRIVGWRAEGRGCDLLIPSGQTYSPWYGRHGLTR